MLWINLQPSLETGKVLKIITEYLCCCGKFQSIGSRSGNLNEEEALNHNLRTQLQTVTEVNKGWDQAYRTLHSLLDL